MLDGRRSDSSSEASILEDVETREPGPLIAE